MPEEVFHAEWREVGSTTPSRPALPPGCLDDARHRCTYRCASGDRRGAVCSSVLTHGPREKRHPSNTRSFHPSWRPGAHAEKTQTCLAGPEAADTHHFIGLTRRCHSRGVRSQSDRALQRCFESEKNPRFALHLVPQPCYVTLKSNTCSDVNSRRTKDAFIVTY